MKIGSSSHKKAVRDGYMDVDTLQIYTPKQKGPEIKNPEIKAPKQETENKKYTYDPEIEEYVAKFKKTKSFLSNEPKPALDKKPKVTLSHEPKIDESFTTEQGVAEICTDIISENKPKFKKLSQTETDELLRKLLYQKLYGEKPKKEKSKLKIKKAYSSSESD
jgi:hypothetical protein